MIKRLFVNEELGYMFLVKDGPYVGFCLDVFSAKDEADNVEAGDGLGLWCESVHNSKWARDCWDRAEEFFYPVMMGSIGAPSMKMA